MMSGGRNHYRLGRMVVLAVAIPAILVGLAQAQSPAPTAKRAPAGASGSGKLSLYVAVGPEITQYDVDLENATLKKLGSVALPAGGDVHVQEAWPDPSNTYIYAAWSNAVP